MTKLQEPTVQYDTAAILGGLYGLVLLVSRRRLNATGLSN